METKLSPAMEIMSAIWKNTPYKSHAHLNLAMQSALRLVIDSDIKFEIDDFAFIHKNFRPGYWMGLSSNGNHYGEHYYTAACQNNTSCVAAFESHYKRIGFILDGKRVYCWIKFRYNDLYCHITGWNAENDTLMAVGYNEGFEKGKRKLLSFNKKEWLNERKLIKIW